MTNETNPGTVEVTQADRDTAAQALTEWYGAGGNCRYDFSKVVKDDHPFTQAFARHRLAAQSQPAATVQEALESALIANIETITNWLDDEATTEAVASRILAALTAEPAAKAGPVAGYLVDGEWTDAEAFKRIKYPEAHRVVTLYAAPPAQDQTKGDEA